MLNFKQVIQQFLKTVEITCDTPTELLHISNHFRAFTAFYTIQANSVAIIAKISSLWLTLLSKIRA